MSLRVYLERYVDLYFRNFTEQLWTKCGKSRVIGRATKTKANVDTHTVTRTLMPKTKLEFANIHWLDNIAINEDFCTENAQEFVLEQTSKRNRCNKSRHG